MWEVMIAVYDMEFDKNAPLWTNKVNEIKKSYEELIIDGWAFRQEDFPAEPTPMLEKITQGSTWGAHQLVRTGQNRRNSSKKNRSPGKDRILYISGE